MKDELDFESSSSSSDEDAHVDESSNARSSRKEDHSSKSARSKPVVKKPLIQKKQVAAPSPKNLANKGEVDELDFDEHDDDDSQDREHEEDEKDADTQSGTTSRQSQRSSQSSISSRRRRKLSSNPGILGSPEMSLRRSSRSSTQSTTTEDSKTSDSTNSRSRRRRRNQKPALTSPLSSQTSSSTTKSFSKRQHNRQRPTSSSPEDTQHSHDSVSKESSSDSHDMPPPNSATNQHKNTKSKHDDAGEAEDDESIFSGLVLGETRAARLKRKAQRQQEQQSTSTRPSKKDEVGVWTANQANGSPAESPLSSLPSSRRGMVKRTRRRRPGEYRKKTASSWSVASSSTISSPRAKQHEESPGFALGGRLLGVQEQQQKQAEDLFSSPEQKVGTTVDMYDLQNNGQAQLLTDEIHYLSDGILQEEGAQISSFAAAMDLAWLLSLEKNRMTLFRDTSADALTTILDLMAKLPSIRHNSTDSESSPAPLTEVWAVLWHFLTLDCTWSSSPSELERARSLRLAILSHKKALEGMVHLVVQEEEGVMRHELEKTAKHCDRKRQAASPESSSSTKSKSPRSKRKRNSARQSSLPVISEERDDQDTVDTQPSVDPTIAGRKRRKLKTNPSSGASVDLDLPQDEDDEESKRTELSFASTISSKVAGSQEEMAAQTEQWSTIKMRVLSTVGKSSSSSINAIAGNASVEILSSHSCGTATSGLPANLLLFSLQRIMTGRLEGAEKSCLDEDSQHKNKGNQDALPDDSSEAEIENNPIVVTNKLLSQHDLVIPYLAKALGQTISRATEMLEREENDSCFACDDETKQRTSILVSVVTDACLFHEGNRDEFCSDDVENCANGETLVGNLVRYLEAMLARYGDDLSGINSLFCGSTPWMSCVALDVLKTLTSLTHENPAVVSEMTRLDAWHVFGELIFYHSTTIASPERHDDLAVFTLDTLANLIESSMAKSSHVHAELARLRVTDKTGRRAKRVLFLPWLVKHLVRLTDSFRFELLGNEMNQSETDSSILVEDRERSNLLLAGNGFVLLAYLLVGNHNKDIESMIINELPGTTFSHKIHFLSKALMAFCNFYRHVVGDLSVAIVAPVQSLLQGLKQKFSKHSKF